MGVASAERTDRRRRNHARTAIQGDGNTATAAADGSFAGAGFGDDNTATATGVDSTAEAGGGDANTAIAETDGCTATAVGTGVTDTC